MMIRESLDELLKRIPTVAQLPIVGQAKDWDGSVDPMVYYQKPTLEIDFDSLPFLSETSKIVLLAVTYKGSDGSRNSKDIIRFGQSLEVAQRYTRDPNGSHLGIACFSGQEIANYVDAFAETLDLPKTIRNNMVPLQESGHGQDEYTPIFHYTFVKDDVSYSMNVTVFNGAFCSRYEGESFDGPIVLGGMSKVFSVSPELENRYKKNASDLERMRDILKADLTAKGLPEIAKRVVIGEYIPEEKRVASLG